MDEVEYNKLDYWGWECPKCKYWNETQDDPGCEKTVLCVGKDCSGEFIPMPG